MAANNVIEVSFQQNSSAYEALSKLKELDGRGQVSVNGAAVVERDQDGHLAVKDETQDSQMQGTATGGLIGLIVGILGGPFGVLIGGATGLLVGSLFDLEDADDQESVLAEISNAVKPARRCCSRSSLSRATTSSTRRWQRSMAPCCAAASTTSKLRSRPPMKRSAPPSARRARSCARNAVSTLATRLARGWTR
jgi:uncharacterized membrane protein